MFSCGTELHHTVFDLNPMEEVWAVMKKFVLKKRCQTLEQLQEAVNQFLRRKLTPKS